MSDNKVNGPSRKRMQTAQQILHNLLDIIELHPQYSIPQHLCSILRRKNAEGPEFFFWSDEELLKRIEQHKEELHGDEFMNLNIEE